MPDELFSASEARIGRPLPLLNARCERCGLYRKCKSPRIPVDGGGRRGILIVGEYPGPTEDETGKPLTGGTGRYLEAELAKLGCNMRRDCWLTNALICRSPDKSQPATAVDDCRPNLLRTIRELSPRVIILAGGLAVQSLIGHLWKPDVGPILRWTGRRIPNHKPNAWICPVNNPAFLLKDKADPVAKLQFREHLRAALELTNVPWPSGPPDYPGRVETILSPATAAFRLERYISGNVAFDFEATALKPDGPHFEIVCCSVSNGRETIAFPWHGPVIPAMRRLLLDPNVGKIAANIKYEDRAVRAAMGIEVVNWKFDTMLAAHVLDARRGKTTKDGAERGSGTTGLKFQAYANFGMPDYNGHLEAYLQSDGGGNAPNRIREIKLPQLLLYNGLDALLEYELAVIQARELGLSWDDGNGPPAN